MLVACSPFYSSASPVLSDISDIRVSSFDGPVDNTRNDSEREAHIAISYRGQNLAVIVPNLPELARIGRNPATGEAIKIKAETTVKFRLSRSAKDAVVPPNP